MHSDMESQTSSLVSNERQLASQCAEHKGQMRKKAKALRVPVTRSGQVLPRAFTHASDIRHLQVEAGIARTDWGPSEACA